MTSKNHSPPEHFRLELSCVLPPIGRLPNAESSFVTLSFERVVGRQRTTHALVHHGEAVVRECLIIHRGLFRQGRCGTEAPALLPEHGPAFGLGRGEAEGGLRHRADRGRTGRTNTVPTV